MIFNILLRIQKPVILGLLPVLGVFLMGDLSIAQQKASDEEKTSNIKWSTKEDVITINYDLNSPTENRYDVSIILKREGDDTFSIVPVAVEGDIGIGPFAGPGREIRWYYRRDLPEGLQGSGYYFEIHVKMVKEGSNLIYYIIGGAAVTGGIIALLLARGQNTTVPPLDLPTPPARP
ncbi:MAG TPA: hypothetical protein VLY03_03995 [Bacteroidota bacterium]|nr:hypothetical protein [Bacteroidota bacterium]